MKQNNILYTRLPNAFPIRKKTALCFSNGVEQNGHTLLSVSVVPSWRPCDIFLGLIHKLLWKLLSHCHLILKLHWEMYLSISLSTMILTRLIDRALSTTTFSTSPRQIRLRILNYECGFLVILFSLRQEWEQSDEDMASC